MKNKPLRVAAWLLIAHFLIAAGLGLTARGGPDYVRMAMMLGLLLVAVSALFKPRPKGWLGVAAYAIYVVGYQAVGLWSTYANLPAMPLGAKVTVAAIWTLLFANPIAALALTLMPSSLAAFASPPAKDDAAKHPGSGQGPAGAGNDTARAAEAARAVGGPPRAQGRNLAILAVVAVAAVIVALYTYRTVPSRAVPGSQWMTGAQFQREFDARGQKGFYPQETEGECQRDGEKFRADWRPTPPGASYYSHFGMTRQDFERRSQEYGTKGYSLGIVKQFRDCSGVDKYQATWMKR